MKKTLSLILALVMVATMFAVITVPASAAVEPKVNASVYDGTMDKDWYNPEAPATEYTLTTAAQLAGLADWVNTDGVKFDGVTIKLGADIIWNEGTFTLGFDGKTPVYNGNYVPENINVWPVIGERPAGNNDQAPTVKEKIDDVDVTRDRKYFYGNFDGQGHVISGLYANNTGAYTSLFSVFYGESIKNLAIVNSFFGSESRTGVFAGFVANANTKKVTLENLYTDAIMVLTKADSNARSGGIIGMARRVNSITIKNAWFDGTISALTTNGYTPYIGGIVGFIVLDAADSLGESLTFDSCLVTGTFNADVSKATDLTKRGLGGIMGSFHTGANAALTSPVNVNVKNCLVAIKATNLARTEETDMRSMGAFIPRFETCWATYTVENSYFVPNGIFSTSNTMSHIDGSATAGTTFNGTLIATKHTVPTEETIPAANIAKIADATGLSTEVFDLTGETAALKTVRTKIEAVVDVWDGTANTEWFDPANVAEEYTLTTAEQLAGLAKLVDEGNKFENVTIKLGANITLNEGTFQLGFDKKTAVYNGALIDEKNPVNVWNPIGVCTTETNNVDVSKANVFWGNFDGQGYVISGMYMNDPDAKQQGLFSVFAGKEIKNVVLTNSYVCGDSRTGSVVGFFDSNNANAVTVENIYSDAIVVAEAGDKDVRTGGLFGMFRQCGNVTLNNLEFAGTVSGICTGNANAMLIGGIVGVICGEDANETYTFTNVKVKAAMYLSNPAKADNAGERRTGGIMGAGYKFYGSFTNCSVEITDTNITAANGFELKRISALVGYHENVGDYTYTDCTFTHNGLFVKGVDFANTFSDLTLVCTVNGKANTEWAADTTGADVATGTHGGFVAAKDATCTEAGNLAHYNCSCGVILDAEGKETTLEAVTLAPTHNYGEWVAPVEPTATEAGVLGHYQCSACHKYFDADKNELASIEGAPALGENTTTPEGDATETPDNTEGNADQPANTTKPATNEPVKKKGCGGFTAVGAVLALVAVMGAAIVIKKK